LVVNFSEHVGGGVAGIGRGAQLPMSEEYVSKKYTHPFVMSDLAEIDDLPLDAEVNLDDIEYARIMRRIDSGDGEPGATVSAFNSSI
jgi:hypothetical protein